MEKLETQLISEIRMSGGFGNWREISIPQVSLLVERDSVIFMRWYHYYSFLGGPGIIFKGINITAVYGWQRIDFSEHSTVFDFLASISAFYKASLDRLAGCRAKNNLPSPHGSRPFLESSPDVHCQSLCILNLHKI